MSQEWIADRMHHIESSGIRRVFELGRTLKEPINLSIGQPHFDVPQSIKKAACAAIEQGRNSYTITQGIEELRQKVLADVRKRLGQADRDIVITAGTSGAIVLALGCAINPGDEGIVLHPYFVIYPQLVNLVGGRAVFVDTYPDFSLDVDKVRQALSPRTKAIIINSPANPTGAVYELAALRDVARLAQEKNILLISDEIYRVFCYDAPFSSPAQFNEQTLVLDGFSKAYGMTGWRLGYAHGPSGLVREMIKLQQFTFVCAPSIVQYSGLAALDFDVTGFVADYRRKRDLIFEGLREHFEFQQPEGAFYVFPKAPWGTGEEFVEEAVRNNVLMIPGSVFSGRNTHFRLSYAAEDKVLRRGIEALNALARK